ncbi:MAG: transposase [Actinobacteria bacterium]|nr:transposase [Actinomycetota bacterium]
MPRGPRIDIPGLVHHVICRGIEKSTIFKDNCDYEQLLARISKHANRESIHIYAFSLMPNHFHLLVHHQA